MKPFRQRINGRIDHTIHEGYIDSFQMCRKGFLCRSASTIHEKRKSLKFSFQLFLLYLSCFYSMCELITMREAIS